MAVCVLFGLLFGLQGDVCLLFLCCGFVDFECWFYFEAFCWLFGLIWLTFICVVLVLVCDLWVAA